MSDAGERLQGGSVSAEVGSGVSSAEFRPLEGTASEVLAGAANVPGVIGSLPVPMGAGVNRFAKQASKASPMLPPSSPSVEAANPSGKIPDDMLARFTDLVKSGRYLVVLCEANPKEVAQDGTVPLTVASYRGTGFHPDWLLRAWKTLGADILKFTPPTPETDKADGTLSGY